MSQLDAWAVAAQLATAMLLTWYYLLALLGLGWKLGAWYYGLPQPSPSPHERWLRSHWPRLAGLAAATALLLAWCWWRYLGLGLLSTAAAELAAGFFIHRAVRRTLRPGGPDD